MGKDRAFVAASKSTIPDALDAKTSIAIFRSAEGAQERSDQPAE